MSAKLGKDATPTHTHTHTQRKLTDLFARKRSAVAVAAVTARPAPVASVARLDAETAGEAAAVEETTRQALPRPKGAAAPTSVRVLGDIIVLPPRKRAPGASPFALGGASRAAPAAGGGSAAAAAAAAGAGGAAVATAAINRASAQWTEAYAATATLADVLGQNAARDAVRAFVAAPNPLARATALGVREPGTRVAALLLCGQTGIGKSLCVGAVARALSRDVCDAAEDEADGVALTDALRSIVGHAMASAAPHPLLLVDNVETLDNADALDVRALVSSLAGLPAARVPPLVMTADSRWNRDVRAFAAHPAVHVVELAALGDAAVRAILEAHLAATAMSGALDVLRIGRAPVPDSSLTRIARGAGGNARVAVNALQMHERGLWRTLPLAPHDALPPLVAPRPERPTATYLDTTAALAEGASPELHRAVTDAVARGARLRLMAIDATTRADQSAPADVTAVLRDRAARGTTSRLLFRVDVPPPSDEGGDEDVATDEVFATRDVVASILRLSDPRGGVDPRGGTYEPFASVVAGDFQYAAAALASGIPAAAAALRRARGEVSGGDMLRLVAATRALDVLEGAVLVHDAHSGNCGDPMWLLDHTFIGEAATLAARGTYAALGAPSDALKNVVLAGALPALSLHADRQRAGAALTAAASLMFREDSDARSTVVEAAAAPAAAAAAVAANDGGAKGKKGRKRKRGEPKVTEIGGATVPRVELRGARLSMVAPRGVEAMERLVVLRARAAALPDDALMRTRLLGSMSAVGVRVDGAVLKHLRGSVFGHMATYTGTAAIIKTAAPGSAPTASAALKLPLATARGLMDAVARHVARTPQLQPHPHVAAVLASAAAAIASGVAGVTVDVEVVTTRAYASRNVPPPPPPPPLEYGRNPAKPEQPYLRIVWERS